LAQILTPDDSAPESARQTAIAIWKAMGSVVDMCSATLPLSDYGRVARHLSKIGGRRVAPQINCLCWKAVTVARGASASGKKMEYLQGSLTVPAKNAPAGPSTS
jgi:hypothetical protein